MANQAQSPKIVEIGKFPEIGVVPEKMHAYTIRPDRLGEPKTSFVAEQVPVWDIGPRQVLVKVMAAGVNFNGIWAGLGKPVNMFDYHKQPYHIAGSDVSGVVWKVGSEVTDWKVGDEVIGHCNRTCGMCKHCNSKEPMACKKQLIWGYETFDGSFAQFTRLDSPQVLRKPPQLSWEDAASYGLTYFTAYRMLIDRAGLRPGDDVLIWGAAGGLGVFAIQLCKTAGARAIAVVSSDEKGELAKKLGAFGVINRKDFPGMQYRENETPEQNKERMQATKAFGKKIWEILGERKGPDVVFEHPGASTFPASVFLTEPFGKIVICGATTGYNLNFDVRHLWMRQKSIIGSHFADAGQANEANDLMLKGMVEPVLTRSFTWNEIPSAHQLMFENKLHGTVSCLVGAPKLGLKNFEETKAAV